MADSAKVCYIHNTHHQEIAYYCTIKIKRKSHCDNRQKKEDRYKKICEKKKSTSAEELCSGFPSEFATYINYTRKLTFEQDPDYDYLKGLFKTIMEKNNIKYDFEYDWTTPEQMKANLVILY